MLVQRLADLERSMRRWQRGCIVSWCLCGVAAMAMLMGAKQQDKEAVQERIVAREIFVASADGKSWTQLLPARVVCMDRDEHVTRIDPSGVRVGSEQRYVSDFTSETISFHDNVVATRKGQLPSDPTNDDTALVKLGMVGQSGELVLSNRLGLNVVKVQSNEANAGLTVLRDEFKKGAVLP